jgi:primosomal protein N' (replication factor Y)
LARVVRVLPDVPAIDKTFDYEVPAAMSDRVRVGTMVRVGLHGRRVGGWVVEDGVTPPAGVTLRPIAKVTGWGPAANVIDLAAWAAWRWAGRRASLLRTASPPGAVAALPPPERAGAPVPAVLDELAREAFDRERAVVRLPPAADPYPLALAAAARGDALIVCPSVAAARHLAMRLRRAGVLVALAPRDWARAAAGATVVGARAAAWAPMPELAAVLVLEEHDEAHQEERTPAWHARDIAVRRAAVAGVPCVLASPCPTLEARAWADVLAPSRDAERAGWALLDVVDRRRDDPVRAGLYSERFVRLLRSRPGGAPIICVLNRRGRARLLACASCGELARCERCGGAMEQLDETGLRCRQCGAGRPVVCLACGATRFKNLRAGVTRAREELEALAGEPVVEVTAATADVDLPAAGVYVGTEAVLHQVQGRVGAVAFLDFDQELLAPRYRAAEQALALLARAARRVGGRAEGGRVLVQTRLPHHPVLDAALHAEPDRLAAAELERRRALQFPPVTALAAVSGPAAAELVAALGRPDGVEVLGPADGTWLLRASDHRTLCDALARTPRPPGRVRIEVDPLRI